MIRYESDDFALWSWVALDKDNRPYGDVLTGDLSTLAEHAKGNKLVLVIAGHSLLITSVDLPEGNIRTISSAIPYAMEEQIAEDVEDMHFVQGKRHSDGTIPVIAISKLYLTDLLRALAEASLYPTWAVAEPLLLTWKENELSISIRDNVAIVRDDEISGYVCSTSQLPTLLTCSDTDMDDLETIRVWQKDGEFDINSLFAAGESRLIINENLSNFEHLTEFGQKHTQINILHGFDVLDSLKTSSGSWKPAVALSLAAVLLYFGTSGYYYYSLRQEINEVTQKSEELFRKTFPDVKRLVQPLVQAQQKLDQRMAANGRATDGLLDLLLALGEAKQKNKSIEFKNLEYRQNSMVVHLEGKSVAQIEAFKQQLESDGNTNTDILSTVSKEDKVEARIKIKAGPV